VTTQILCCVDACLSQPTIIRPIPLCVRHSIEVALAALPIVLTDALVTSDETEIEVEPEPIDASELERAALAALRVTSTPIGRRTVEQAIRSMGGRCSSERAQALARWARDGSDLSLFDQTTV